MDIQHKVKLYEALINELEEGVHVVDAKGKTVVFNDKMRQLKGLLREEMQWMSSDSLIYHVLKTKQGIVHHKRNDWLSNGREFVTISDYYPICDEQTLIGAIEITKDVTENELMAFQPLRRYGSPLTFETITAISKKMRAAIQKAKLAAEHRMPTLLYGESGTGKDLVAEGMYHASEEAASRYVTLICRYDDDALLNELQAVLMQPSATIFCDRLEYMQLENQQKLVQLLEENGMKHQLIASVGADPIELIQEGKLLKELYYYFASVCIHIPALRERKEDIQPFVTDFLRRLSDNTGSVLASLSPKVEAAFQQYDWPGNLKELEVLLEETVMTIRNEKQMEFDHLPIAFRFKVEGNTQQQAEKDMLASSKKDIRPLQIVMEELEESYIRQALSLFDGNVSQTATALGIKRQSLQYRMKKFPTL